MGIFVNKRTSKSAENKTILGVKNFTPRALWFLNFLARLLSTGVVGGPSALALMRLFVPVKNIDISTKAKKRPPKDVGALRHV